jgi:3,4-dihydroxy 2-butanone 4-phosphate synthase/GTP cyclohydrolase II
LGIASIETAVEAIREGRMVILVDDEDRENEGDLVVAAEKITPEGIQFMAHEGRGLICLSLTSEQVGQLGLAPMVDANKAPLGTAFTVSVDAADLKEDGISAQARAHTILEAIRADATPQTLMSPGNMHPLAARAGGVLVRAGQTEGSVDLARLAGLHPSGVICEIMSEDGSMARLPELLAFGEKHSIPVVTVADLIEYRMHRERLVRASTRAFLPTEYGEFEIIAYETDLDPAAHIVLQHGEISADKPTLVRVHRADLLEDTLGVGLTRGRHKLDMAMRRIASEGSGLLLYLRGDTLEDDLSTTLARYCSPNTFRVRSRSDPSTSAAPPMDFRDFGIGAQILADMGVQQLRVISDHPLAFKGLGGFGLEIVEWVPLALSY